MKSNGKSNGKKKEKKIKANGVPVVTKGDNGGSMGQPPREIDYVTVEAMAQRFSTDAEIAKAIKFSESGFAKRKRTDTNLVDAIRKGMGFAIRSIRAKQFEVAVTDGDVTMLRHLGINYLGQTSQSLKANIDFTKETDIDKIPSWKIHQMLLEEDALNGQN